MFEIKQLSMIININTNAFDEHEKPQPDVFCRVVICTKAQLKLREWRRMGVKDSQHGL
jgi:hypothetical protein